MTRPTIEEAYQFALMIKNGYPTKAAIQYFYPDELDHSFLLAEHDKWTRSKTIRDAVKAVQGNKEWVDMPPDEQIRFAINKHYCEMAYFLYSHNYSELAGAEKVKADTCRVSLEAHLAGTSGKMDPLNEWLRDLKNGSLKLPALPS